MSKVHVFTGKWTINKLCTDYYRQNKLLFNTEYQRSEIWKSVKKQKLIDSIVKDYNIGMIFLRKKNDAYEVLDGQQRLRTIFEFMENEYPTSGLMTPEIGEKTYEELKRDADAHAKFNAFQIDIAFVENADDETTADIFLRLQEGIPLNTAEKLNAMRGKIRNAILDLSKHGFVKQTSITDHRFAHRLLCAQLVKLQKDTDFELMKFPNIKFEELKGMYEKYSLQNPPGQVIVKVKRTLNFLRKAFGRNAKIITRRGDFIPIYLLYSYLDRKYVIRGIEKDLVNFAIEFLSRVGSINTRSDIINAEDKLYREFKIWRSAGALSSRSFKERFRIILGKFLEYESGLRLKDEQRFFDEGQKLAIYYRDNGRCQECRKSISLDEAEFDHKKPWAKGGSTTVGNGQLLCTSCNRRKGTD